MLLWTDPLIQPQASYWLAVFKQTDFGTPPAPAIVYSRGGLPMWMLRTVNISLQRTLTGVAEALLLNSSFNSSSSLEPTLSYTNQHEGCRIYLRPEEQGRRRRHGALPVRPEPDHFQVQDPAAGWADDRVPPGHEQLLQQAERARTHTAYQQEGQQGWDPTARHRLHLGPAGRAGRAGEEPAAVSQQRTPHTADYPERRARQHHSGGKYPLTCPPEYTRGHISVLWGWVHNCHVINSQIKLLNMCERVRWPLCFLVSYQCNADLLTYIFSLPAEWMLRWQDYVPLSACGAPSPHSEHSGEWTRLPDVAHTSISEMNLELCRDVSYSQMLEKNKCCADIFKPAWISVTQGSRFIRGPWEKKSGGVQMQTGLAGGPRHVQCNQRRLLPVEFLKKNWCFCYALCILCKPYREKSFCKRKSTFLRFLSDKLYCILQCHIMWRYCFLTMYLIGVFIKTRQLFFNKNSSVSLRVCVRANEPTSIDCCISLVVIALEKMEHGCETRHSSDYYGMLQP